MDWTQTLQCPAAEMRNNSPTAAGFLFLTGTKWQHIADLNHVQQNV